MSYVPPHLRNKKAGGGESMPDSRGGGGGGGGGRDRRDDRDRGGGRDRRDDRDRGGGRDRPRDFGGGSSERGPHCATKETPQIERRVLETTPTEARSLPAGLRPAPWPSRLTEGPPLVGPDMRRPVGLAGRLLVPTAASYYHWWQVAA